MTMTMVMMPKMTVTMGDDDDDNNDAGGRSPSSDKCAVRPRGREGSALNTLLSFRSSLTSESKLSFKSSLTSESKLSYRLSLTLKSKKSLTESSFRSSFKSKSSFRWVIFNSIVLDEELCSKVLANKMSEIKSFSL